MIGQPYGTRSALRQTPLMNVYELRNRLVYLSVTGNTAEVSTVWSMAPGKDAAASL